MVSCNSLIRRCGVILASVAIPIPILRRPTARHLLAAITLAVASLSAFAIPFSGALSTTDPLFNRPRALNALSTASTAVHYDVIPFTVSADGVYSFETTSAAFSPGSTDDTFLLLYRNAFNPATPLVDVLALNDDIDFSAGNRLSRIGGQSLFAGTDYFLVVTSFFNGVTGTYADEMSTVRGGDIVIGGRASVPEPGTLALLGIAFAGLGAMRLRTRGQRVPCGSGSRGEPDPCSTLREKECRAMLLVE